MLCPVCNVDLMMSDRSGVEIDYCPKCRGVWLDRGELDKIIERSTPVNERANSSYSKNDYHQSHHNDGYYKKKKRESWIGELFDF
ncbi:zf-TFIIB domain-containing protein [Campylobacter upsaliensis]|uniref:TFIIB-type zinc ribbon-containing protein n=1 Tax=Campylobacter upsaliensis TaxID=28080 RepID=UPI0022EB97B0|nr:zf-TFIIB domain-containing protein [Campylobacter upsaliensis]MEB2811290.1 zf-TFIIB domain-containing protein [Campylobacter upsaliensis]